MPSEFGNVVIFRRTKFKNRQIKTRKLSLDLNKLIMRVMCAGPMLEETAHWCLLKPATPPDWYHVKLDFGQADGFFFPFSVHAFGSIYSIYSLHSSFHKWALFNTVKACFLRHFYKPEGEKGLRPTLGREL